MGNGDRVGAVPVPEPPATLLRQVQYLRLLLEGRGIVVPGSPACARPVVWRGATLGGPVPVVAVATTGADAATCAAQARAARLAGAEVVELRADLLTVPGAVPADASAVGSVRRGPEGLVQSWLAAARAVGEVLCGCGIPVLLTVRTAAEGGGFNGDDVTYRAALGGLIEAIGGGAGVAGTGERAVVAVDIESVRGDLPCLVPLARRAGLDVVASYHDFDAAPDELELLRRMQAMQDAGASVAKVAVTPADTTEAERVLGAAARARGELDIPVVVIAMGAAGTTSRLAGGVFGSALTFATAGGAGSAPGQLPIKQVREALALLHS